MTSALSLFKTYPKQPLELFKCLLSQVENLVTINVATIDREMGVLNRTVVYRGLTDGAVTFVTERNTRKYENLKENPKLSLTFYFPDINEEVYQVRLLDAVAEELQPQQIQKLWEEEPLHAKIRSHICKCGAPVDPAQLQQQHDALLKDYEAGVNHLAQTDTYTAFKVIPNRWDFYKAGPQKIGDRVQYRRTNPGSGQDEWDVFHVAA